MAFDPSREPVVEAIDVVRSYGEHRGLDGLSVRVPAGSIFGLLGPNGSGKSTFLALLAASETPDSGTITVFGEAPTIPARRRMGIVFQESTLDPLATVEDNLALSGRLYGLSRRECRQRSADLLDHFGLRDRLDHSVTRLSGGMRRRVDIARALLHDPELLLMDEPTTGIDPGERLAIWAALRPLVDEGRTVLLATNDLVEADGVCDYAAFLRDGRAVTAGTPGELKRGLQRESVWLDWDATEEETVTIAAWPGVGSVAAQDATVQVTVDDASIIVPRLFQYAGPEIRGVRIHPATLQDAYFHHVGARADTPREVPA